MHLNDSTLPEDGNATSTSGADAAWIGLSKTGGRGTKVHGLARWLSQGRLRRRPDADAAALAEDGLCLQDAAPDGRASRARAQGFGGKDRFGALRAAAFGRERALSA